MRQTGVAVMKGLLEWAELENAKQKVVMAGQTGVLRMDDQR